MLRHILLGIGEEFIALLIGLIFFNYLNKAFRLIAVHASIAFTVEFFAYFFLKRHTNNSWLYNLFLIIDWSLLFFASYLLLNKKRYLFLFTCGFILFIGVWFYNLISNKGLGTFFETAYQANCILLLTAYFFVLYETAMNSKRPIFKLAKFWICVSIVLFYGCTIFYFSFNSVELKYLSKSENHILLVFLDILSSFRYLLTAYSFYLFYDNKKKFSKPRTHAD